MDLPLEFPPADGEEDLNKTQSGHRKEASKTIGEVSEFVTLEVDESREAVVLLDQVTKDTYGKRNNVTRTNKMECITRKYQA